MLSGSLNLSGVYTREQLVYRWPNPDRRTVVLAVVVLYAAVHTVHLHEAKLQESREMHPTVNSRSLVEFCTTEESGQQHHRPHPFSLPCWKVPATKIYGIEHTIKCILSSPTLSSNRFSELATLPVPRNSIAVTRNQATRKPTHTSPLAPRSARWTRRGRRKRSPRRQQPTSLSTDLPKIASQPWFPFATCSSCRVRAGRRHLPWRAPSCPSGWRSTSPPMSP